MKLMHFEIFCGGSDKAKIIEKGQIAASKDKQKSKSLIEKDTKLYQHIPEPAKDISFSKGGETKKDGTYYSGANAIKRLASEGNYEQWQLVGEYRAKKVLEKKTLISKKKHVKIYEIIAGTKQSFWMEKGLPKQKKYGKSKHKDADYYTKQDIKGWSEKPLGIIPDTTLKTVPFDLYAKKGRKTVTFQKKKYHQYIIRERSCDSQKIYMAYIKESDIKKYSKHAWKDFVSIKESNPASIGTSAKETLVQTRAEEIKTVPALGRIASKDDDLSDFAKQVLEKIELHKTIENEEIEKEVCLLTGYKKLPTIYDCEQERSKLIRLVCRHPTEWYVTPKKANVLKLNDAQRKEQEALGWWEDAKGVKGLPEPHNVWHFHPAGFVGGKIYDKEYIVDIIPKSKKHRSGKAMIPTSLTIHSTGNPTSVAKGERGWLTNPTNVRVASFHIVVDQNRAIECIPFTEVAWHAGDKTGNTTSIGLEICESGDRAATLENAIRLTAQILFDKGWDTSNLRMHNDWSGKNCPRILRTSSLRTAPHQSWDWFKQEVGRYL